MSKRSRAAAGLELVAPDGPEPYPDVPHPEAKVYPSSPKQRQKQEKARAAAEAARFEGGLFECVTNVIHRGEFYEPGDEIELDGPTAYSVRENVKRLTYASEKKPAKVAPIRGRKKAN